MKKLIGVLLLGIICAGSVIFAEDAKVMPKRMGRVYIAPTYAFANSTFDKDGERQDTKDGKGAFKFFNLGLVVEYGITDWISGAVQWAPGWNIWSDVDQAFASGADANLKSFGDIFVGAKMQIIGAAAPVESSMFRLCLGPGIKIPLPAPDFEDEYANMLTGDEATVGKIDKNVFGFGLRTYFDYIINDMFFVNFYNEFLYYPVKGESKNYAFGRAGDLDVAYGYDLTFEVEGHFQTSFGDGLVFNAGLPVNFKMSPDVKIDGDTVDDSGSMLLSLKPNAMIFLTKLFLPMQFKLSYSLPVWGQNTNATHSLTLQARIYFKI
ncbi:hypothetical protein LJC14_02030 [Treponema sp. OttesenSCG-928-L16]|nr:hypothetical protein [Treponema sp. OttesenSCG-928-L16]